MQNGYSKHSYEEAILCLNKLQTNKDVLDEIRKHQDSYALFNLPKIKNIFERLKIPINELNKLNVIHVAGTKGKGSTCTFTEHILRNHGYKTGLFSSPHVETIRERIKINGRNIDKNMFTTYFWRIYYELLKTQGNTHNYIPSFFQFLTCMALYIFLKEKVDVAILEVGIGGQYDSTNIIEKPIACGITSIGIDHVSILGDTHAKIAWHKAGIIKPGVPSFTVMQHPEAMRVLRRRARENKSILQLSPPLDTYHDMDDPTQNLTVSLNGFGSVSTTTNGHTKTTNCQTNGLLISKNNQFNNSHNENSKNCNGFDHSSVIASTNDIFRINASLAIQLANAFITATSKKDGDKLNEFMNDDENTYNNYDFDHAKEGNQSLDEQIAEYARNAVWYDSAQDDELPALAPTFPLNRAYINALETCKLDGRTQIIPFNGLKLYLDGAHTQESIEYSTEWFTQMVEAEEQLCNKSSNKYALIFNCTGDRDPKTLLKPLKNFPFSLVLFCPNIRDHGTPNIECFNVTLDKTQQMQACIRNCNIWNEMNKDLNQSCGHLNKPTLKGVEGKDTFLCWDDERTKPNFLLDNRVLSSTASTNEVVDCVDHAIKACQTHNISHVFITGSLYLVGAVLQYVKIHRKQAI